MAAKTAKQKRDIEKNYTTKQLAMKLRRLADCIEKGSRFQIQIAGERIAVPPDAIINIEHERSASMEEVEFQIKWKPA
ncbi:MAG: amphi-Trp domain-containing protein [Desulfobacterium sp.]|nr:amphi-Trp domain-containing protein [Desulfobacterium sp.]